MLQRRRCCVMLGLWLRFTPDWIAAMVQKNPAPPQDERIASPVILVSCPNPARPEVQ
jgi:hypothetical protein